MFAATVGALPPGTIISNTASIDFNYHGTSLSNTVISNRVDTTVAQWDSAPPAFLSALISPSHVSNGGVPVLITAALFDSTGIDTVYSNLAVLGLGTLGFRNDGISPDTLAGDSIWNATLIVDSRVMGDTFSIPITARDSGGYSDTTYVTLSVQDTSPSYGVIRSLGWNLMNDVRVAGDAVSLFVSLGDTFSSVKFEYRKQSDISWTLCDTATWSGANPDQTGPQWGIFWNMSALADDTYLVRATVKLSSGVEDPSPAYLRIIKDSRDSWINEYNDIPGARHVRRQRFTSGSEDTTIIIEGTALTVPNAAMASGETMWIRVIAFMNGAPSEAPAPSSATGLVVVGQGVYRRFEREDGNHYFHDYVLISIPYSDTALTVSEDDLAIYRYDETLGSWIKEDGCEIDKVRNIVSVRLRHFTDFSVFGVAPAENLLNVLIYPNPYIPYDNDPQTGSPYVKGDNTTGIVFRNLPASVTIDIYSSAGRKVAEMRSNNTGGNLQWDARADNGGEVASGVYVAIIKTSNGASAIRKFMVIR